MPGTIQGIFHRFAEKGSNEVSFIAVNCEGCDRNCAFTGLEAERSEVLDREHVILGSPSTRLVVAESLEELQESPTEKLESHRLQLPYDGRPIGFNGPSFNEFVLNAVAQLREENKCLVDRARGSDLLI